MRRDLIVLLPVMGMLAACASTIADPAVLERVQAQWEGAPQGAAPIGEWWTVFGDPALDSLVEDALANNLNIQIAAERVLEARAARRSSRAARLPEITGQVALSDGNGGASAAVLAGTWNVDAAGRLGAIERIARAGEAATAADAEAVRQLTVAETAGAYVDYRLQIALVVRSDAVVAAQTRTQAITRDRFEIGISGELEVRRGETLLAQARAAGVSAREGAELARHRLALLLATTPDAIDQRLAAADEVPSASAPGILEGPADAVMRRPDVAVAYARYQAAAAGRDEVAARRFPSMTLSALIGGQGLDADALLREAVSIDTVALDLLAPLFDFGGRANDLDAADARVRQARLEYERVLRLAVSDIQSAIVRYVQGEAQSRERADALTSAQRAAEISRLQYQEGLLSQLEVLDAERTVLQAEQDQAVAQAAVGQRVIGLYLALGSAPASADPPGGS